MTREINRIESVDAESDKSIQFAEKLDAVCDRFECDWVKGECPNINDYLSDFETHQRPTVIKYLAPLDMEYQWRRTTTNNSSTGPLWEDFCKRFQELGDASKLPLHLVGEEYRIRLLWGDQPSQDEYLERFSHAPGELTFILDAAFAQAWPMTAKLFEQGHLLHAVQLTARMEAGRQRKNEPDPYCTVRVERGCRWIIAGRLDRTLSRRHVQFEIQPNGQVQVENVSEKNPIVFEQTSVETAEKLNEGHTLDVKDAPADVYETLVQSSKGLLAPGENAVLHPPFLLAVGNKVIRVAAAL